MGARAVNVALGLWLFLSAFLWPHNRPESVNAIVVGMAAVTAALAALGGLRWCSYVNATLGGWLIVSALFLPRASMATFWNHVFVGLGLALFGFARDLRDIRHRTPGPT
jgi:hypothetical protein